MYNDYPWVFPLMTSFAIFLVIGLLIGSMLGHKIGQISAINGDIQYELVEQCDKTMKWKRVKSH